MMTTCNLNMFYEFLQKNESKHKPFVNKMLLTYILKTKMWSRSQIFS